MTEQKTQPKEQVATHIYRRPEARELSATSVDANTHQRVVTRHREVQPTAGESYVQRRNRLYSARTKAPAHHAPTPRRARTLAQTGVPAAGGLKRPLPHYHQTPVPVRSGRRHTRRLGFLWRIFGFFAVVVMVILGANFALTSSAFRVAQVNVVGTHNDLLVSSIQHMGMQGQNIFLIDVVALTQRIEMLPVVASANLEKQWPNQLQVSVTERTPVLLWQTPHGTYSVDRHGVVIAATSKTSGAGALMIVVDVPPQGKISGVRGTEIHPGVQLNAADIAFAMAVFAGVPKVAGVTDFSLRYIDSMPTAPANVPASIGGHGGYVVESKAGWTAYLGGANDANPLNNRLIELHQILELGQQEHLSLATIDLRFGLRPVYTLKQA